MLMSVKTDGRSPVSERQSEHKGEAPVSGWRERKVFTRQQQRSGYCLSEASLAALSRIYSCQNRSIRR